MKKMHVTIIGTLCAGLLATGLALALPKTAEANAETRTVALNATGGSVNPGSVELTAEGTLPALPTPGLARHNFWGWYTAPVETEFWGDDDGETWEALRAKYSGYHYIRNRAVASFGDQDWKELSWGFIIATKGEPAKAGDVCTVSTLYAMWDPDNITVMWHANGWQGVDDRDLSKTSIQSGIEYGGKISMVPLDAWKPWNSGAKFLGWSTKPDGSQRIEARTGAGGGLVSSAQYPSGNVLHLYAVYEGSDQMGDVEFSTAKVLGVTGGGTYFDPHGECNFRVSFDSHSKIFPKLEWKITEGSEWFDLITKQNGEFATLKAKNADALSVRIVEGGNVAATVQVKVENGETYTLRVIAAHDYDNGRITRSGSCTVGAIVEYHCRNCGQVSTKEFEPDGHRYIIARSQPVTCTQDGWKERVCVVCGYEEGIRISTGKALGHDYETTTQVGCGGVTVTTTTCRRCGESHSDGDLASLPHVWGTSYTVDSAATCTTDGWESIHCTKCGAVKDGKAIPALGHHFDAWKVETEATETEPGLRVRVCETCGERETMEIPVLTKDPVEPEVDPEVPVEPEVPEVPVEPEVPEVPVEPEETDPKIDVPEADEPEADVPAIDVPEADEPEADVPEVVEPEVDEPEVVEPEVVEPSDVPVQPVVTTAKARVSHSIFLATFHRLSNVVSICIAE